MPKTIEDNKARVKARWEENFKKEMSESEFEIRYKEEYDRLISRIPRRYQIAKGEDVPEVVLDCLPLVSDLKNGIYLWGAVGTGKTHTLYALRKYFAEIITDFKVVNMTEMLAEIRNSFDENSKIDILDERYVAYDDVGAEKESEWVGEQIYRLVNDLYENKRAFVFTSNLSLGELAKRCGVQGDRIASRIAEMANVVELKGNDRRI